MAVPYIVRYGEGLKPWKIVSTRPGKTVGSAETRGQAEKAAAMRNQYRRRKQT
jgi:hypothetical protein